MGFLKNRKTAAAVMVLMIAAAVLFGSHRSLTALSGRVEAAFRNGVEDDGFSIAADLEKRDAIAYNMTVIALHYYDEGDGAIRAVQNAREALDSAKTPGEKAKADRVLEESVTALHDLLKNTQLTEKDEKYPDRLYDDFRSRGLTISKNGYNLEAEKYNRALRQFPANILAGLTGVKPAELYQ